MKENETSIIDENIWGYIEGLSFHLEIREGEGEGEEQGGIKRELFDL